MKNTCLTFMIIFILANCTSSDVNSPEDLINSDTSTQWTKTSKIKNNDAVESLASDGTNLYAGSNQSGFFHSSDNGDSWFQNIYDEYDYGFIALGVYKQSNDENVLFASNAKTLLSSLDHGRTWNYNKKSYEGGFNSIYNIQDPTLGSILFLGELPNFESSIYTHSSSGGGNYRSTDGGNNWEKVFEGVSLRNITKNFNDDTYFAYNHYGVHTSNDRGASWNLIQNCPTYLNSLVLREEENVACIYISKSTSVYVSKNNGQNWIEIRNGLPDHGINWLVRWDSVIFAGTINDGIFILRDGSSNWQAVNSGLENTSVYRLVIHGPYLIAGTLDGEVWRRLLNNFQND